MKLAASNYRNGSLSQSLSRYSIGYISLSNTKQSGVIAGKLGERSGVVLPSVDSSSPDDCGILYSNIQ
jgi:hypothetical protein